MATWHGYIGIENLNLSATQRQILIDALKALGPGSDPQPARLCHWRTRLDNEAAIFEANFNEDNLTVAVFKDRLGAILGVDPAAVDHSTGSQTFDTLPTPIVVFSRTGTDYVRFALFGGQSAEWMQSGDECRAYLKLNQAEWEPTEV
jgi:hypothetical protein